MNLINGTGRTNLNTNVLRTFVSPCGLHETIAKLSKYAMPSKNNISF